MRYQRRMRLTALLALAAAGLLTGLAMSQTAEQLWNNHFSLLSGALTPSQVNLLADYTRHRVREDLIQQLKHQPETDALMDQLTLTDAQADQIIAIINANLGSLMEAGRPLFTDEKAIHAALLADPPDPATLRAEADVMAYDLGSLAVAASRVARDSRRVLSPIQNDALDRLLMLQSQIEQENVDRMPSDTDLTLATWKELDLRPVQVDRLFNLVRPLVRTNEAWHNLYRAGIDPQLAFILTRDQMRTLTGFRRNHDPERKAVRDEIVDQLLTLRDVDLTRDQMDRLTAVVENELPDIYLSAQSWVDGTQALRNQVMARDPDENAIRSTAAGLGDVISDNLALQARMITQARTVLGGDQFTLIDQFVTYLENKARVEFEKIPDRFADLTALRTRLGLTPDQRRGVTEIMRRQRNDMQRQWSVIAGGGGGGVYEGSPGMY